MILQSVERTTEILPLNICFFSVVRFSDYVKNSVHSQRFRARVKTLALSAKGAKCNSLGQRPR
jgi:hypothetical protein